MRFLYGLQMSRPTAAAQTPPTIQKMLFMSAALRVSAMSLTVGCGRCVARLLVFGGLSPVCGKRLHLRGMDSVRFGRALGVGARAAAKTLVSAVDAAAAPNPSAGGKGGGRKAAAYGSTAASASGTRLGERAAGAASRTTVSAAGLKQGGKQFGKAVWRPVVKLSGVLWLELTGVFFGIFALSAAGAAWRLRAGMHEAAAGHLAHERFEWSVVVAVVFAYFSVTSFLKARRRGRGR